MATRNSGKTAIVNDTKQVLSMRVGSHRHFADLATVPQGATYTMDVDFNGTYQEFQLTGVGEGPAGDRNRKLVVSSDECCDYSCITVKELGDGKLGVQKEPRKKKSSSSPTFIATTTTSSSSSGDDTILSESSNSIWRSIWSWTTFRR